MRITLCTLNSQYIHSSLAPWYLAAGLRAYAESAPQYCVVEGTVNQDDRIILESLAQTSDMLCISCYIWNWRTVERLLPLLKKQQPQRYIVLGGPEVAFRQDDVLHNHPEVDFVIAGEGERALAKLVDALCDNGDVSEVEGLARRTISGVEKKPSAVLCEQPPSPYSEAYFSQLNGRIAYLETSRGCPFSCTYCLSGRKDNVRFFSIDYAKEMLVRLANSGSCTIKLVDRTFNCNPTRAREIWQFLIDNVGALFPKTVCFHFEIGADLLGEEDYALLAKAPAGLFQFEAGIQSFYEPTLEAVHRCTNLAKLCTSIRTLLQADNIHIHIDLIAGLPFEDMAEFARSFNKAFELQPHMLQLGFLKMLYGSQLRQQASIYHYVYDDHPPYEFSSYLFMDEQDKTRLRAIELELDRLYNSARFCETVRYVLSASGLLPFALFDVIGKFMQQYSDNKGVQLDIYIARLQKCLLTISGIDAEELRNAMVLDCLCHSKNGRLPACLEREDKRRLKLRRLLLATHPLSNGERRAVAILYGPEERAAVVEYTHPHPLTGRYACWIGSLLKILENPADEYHRAEE